MSSPLAIYTAPATACGLCGITFTSPGDSVPAADDARRCADPVPCLARRESSTARRNPDLIRDHPTTPTATNGIDL